MIGHNNEAHHGFRGQYGAYYLLNTLGHGGFGKVYLGEHMHLHTKVAVKVLHKNLVYPLAERFKREAETVARLPPHSHVVRMLDYNVQGGRPYIIMDYASNGSMRQCHDFGVSVSLPDVVSYVRQVASGLEHLHSFGIVHCDVKPENMFIGSQGEILIGDFSIAVGPQEEDARNEEEIFGSVAYMAPEQINGRPETASDQYALAVVTYEWLTGQLPFTGDTDKEIADKHLYDQPPPMRTVNPSIPEAVDQAVMKALHKDPGQRYPSVTAFARSLEAASMPSRSDFSRRTTIRSAGTRGMRRSPRRRPSRFILQLLLIAPIICTLFVFDFLLTPEATVTIDETGLGQSWGEDVSSVIGSTSIALNPAAAHLETIETAPQAMTVPATGMLRVSATQAYGEVTLYNSDLAAHFIPADSIIAVPNSTLQVATDEDVEVPAAIPPQEGQASVRAHIVQAGVDGNIAAGALFGATCCPSANIHVNNMSAFIGGQDAHTYSVVQQSDIDRPAMALVGEQRQNAPDLLRRRAGEHEQLVDSSIQCTLVVSSNNAIGSKAPTVTVTVKSNCTGILFNTDAVRSYEVSRFIGRENQMIGHMFVLAGSVGTKMTGVRVIAADKNLTRLNLHVVATGVWLFDFNAMQMQRLLQAIAGKKLSEASTLLKQLTYKPGVNTVTIQFSWNHPGFAEDRLPGDIDRIILEVVHEH